MDGKLHCTRYSVDAASIFIVIPSKTLSGSLTYYFHVQHPQDDSDTSLEIF